MNIGGQARPLRTREEVEAQLRAAAAAAAAIANPPDEDDADDPRGDQSGAWPWRRTLAVAALLLGVAWLGLLAYVQLTRRPAGADPLAEIAAFLPMATGPLALIGVGWLLVALAGPRGTARFAKTAAGLRIESQRLEEMLASLTARLDEHRELVADGAERLVTLGDDATARLARISGGMNEAAVMLAQQSDALGRAAAGARGEMDVLMADLPRAAAQADNAGMALREAGIAAHEQAGMLEDRIASIAQRGREADEATGSAATRLAAQLARVESAGAAAGKALETAGAALRGETDAALAAATHALAEARSGIDTQGRAMHAMIDEANARFAATGAEAGRALDQRLAAAAARLVTLGATLDAQQTAAAGLLATLETGVDAADTRLAGFEGAQRERVEGLVTAIAGLRTHADRTMRALGEGTDTADALIARADAIGSATDTITAAFGTTLPPLMAAAEAQAGATRASAEGALPAIHALAQGAAAAASRLESARVAVSADHAGLAAIVEATQARLDGLVTRAAALTEGIATAGTASETLTEHTGPALIEALLRVRETANQAADKARSAIAAVIPEAAEALARAGSEAMEQALTERVGEQMARIADTADAAVRAAQAATDRLMRQMLTIADTSAAVERRIEEARAEAQSRDEEGFPRQAALLIESLNSLSIDVAKAMAADPGDAAWAAYMRGDRSVFTRRAVRLLDGGQLKEVARLYEEDDGFRERVNRYIHDFEAMLRRVLDSRDGSSLGVTLLSSDIGKLYVALAQAIERLRT